MGWERGKFLHGKQKHRKETGDRGAWLYTLSDGEYTATLVVRVTYRVHQCRMFKQDFNPFLFIKNKRLFLSSEGFSTLEKNALIC
jgi:hypothetical protein